MTNNERIEEEVSIHTEDRGSNAAVFLLWQLVESQSNLVHRRTIYVYAALDRKAGQYFED